MEHNADQMGQRAAELADTLVVLISTYGLSVIGAIVILIVGWIAAGWISGAIGKAMERTGKVEVTLQGFVRSLVRYGILAFTIIAVLNQFGVQTASLIAVLGAAGLAIGLALQGTLGHVAAGVMLLLFRPFKVGDYIEAAGIAGTVKAITLFTTELATPDNVKIVVPNGKLWDQAVVNYSGHSTRRVDLVMGIDYSDDIATAEKTILSTIAQDPRVHQDPAPFVAVSELAASSVNFVIRIWCDAGDYWGLKFDMTRKLKENFDAAGLSIPFPQQTMHIAGGEAPKPAAAKPPARKPRPAPAKTQAAPANE